MREPAEMLGCLFRRLADDRNVQPPADHASNIPERHALLGHRMIHRACGPLLKHQPIELRRIEPNIRILVLTNYEEDEYIFRALQAGAMGYLLKSTPQEEIVQAVEMVHANKRCVPPIIAKRLLETIAREELTQRELEVLKLVAVGLTNKEIAQRLFISAKTARNHVASCLVKLGATDRTEAATTAVRRGLIRLSE